MLLTITYRQAPATDLGYLLHKNPARPQVFEMSFGRVYIFYPRAESGECTAALLLDPLASFIVGGIGAFLGDFFFYPAPMFVSLVTHGLQAVVISLVARRFARGGKGGQWLAVSLGAVIMVVGYSLGRAYVYSTPEYAMLKLPAREKK